MSHFDPLAGTYETAVNTAVVNTLGGASSREFVRQKCLSLQAELRTRGRTLSQLVMVDVGCGTGVAEEFLAGSFQKIIATDSSTEMLSQLERKQLTGVETLLSTDNSIPLPDQSVDLVLAICVMHHMNDHARALEDWKRLLKPDGLLVIFEHNPWNPLTRYAVRQCPVDGDAHLVFPGTLRTLSQQTGFKNSQTRYLFFFPRWAQWLVGLERFLGWCPAGAQYRVVAEK